MLSRPLIAVAALLAVSGCARATLPYRPEPQPPGARVSAAYQVAGDRLGVEIDTDGRPLEQAWIMKPDGTALAPEAVETPPVVAGSSPSIGIGVGGGSSRVAGNTRVWFPLAPAGPPPWRLYVKLAGIVPTTFFVGGPPPP